MWKLFESALRAAGRSSERSLDGAGLRTTSTSLAAVGLLSLDKDQNRASEGKKQSGNYHLMLPDGGASIWRGPAFAP